MSIFPPVDHARFKWRKADHDPHKYFREISGSELFIEFASHNHNELVLFNGIHAVSHIALPDPARLKTHAHEAWASVRRKVPTIAANVEYPALGNALLTYRIPTAEEVDAWLNRTVRMEQGTDIDTLRTRLSDEPAPDQHGDMSWIYLIPTSDTTFSLLLHTSHIPFDATGGYIVINHFLRELARRMTLTTSVSASSNITPPWGQEVSALCPCPTNVLGPEEAKQGDPRYDETLSEILSDLGHALEKNHGLRPRSSGVGRTIRLGHTFTAPETALLLSVLRKKGFTLNHAAQAALTLLTLRDNPPHPDSDSIVAYYALLNGRQRLASPYNTREGFVSICVAISIMKVPVGIVPGVEGEKDHTMVGKIAEHLKGLYQKQKANPALLAVLPQEMEYMLSQAKEALRGGNAPPSWPAPWFSGDGITDRYLQQQHADSNGKSIIDVTDCFVSVNKVDPAPCFRCHSWRGRLILSVDYNEGAIPYSDMRFMMQEWRRLIWLFTQ